MDRNSNPVQQKDKAMTKRKGQSENSEPTTLDDGSAPVALDEGNGEAKPRKKGERKDMVYRVTGTRDGGKTLIILAERKSFASALKWANENEGLINVLAVKPDIEKVYRLNADGTVATKTKPV